MNYYIVAIVILIICYFISQFIQEKKINNELTKGFWIAPPDFLADAGLEAMLLYIGDRTFMGNYHSYILIQGQGGELIVNTPTDLSISTSILMPYYKNTSEGVIEFSDMEENAKFPLKQDIKINIAIGKIILSKEDTIYGVLYRSPELTEKLFS